MNSLRVRLFAILLVTTGIVWLSAIGWIYFSTQAQVEKVLDARLREAAHMVDSLITDRRIDVASAANIATDANRDFTLGDKPYERQLSCQIWSLSGALIGQSAGAPRQALGSHDSGFQQTAINGDRWRVYAVVNRKLGVRVLVGDSLQVRQRLVDNVIRGLVLPAALILPALAALIWISLGRGLAPLRNLAEGLAARSAEDLQPVPVGSEPSELRPVSRSLNGLFERLNASRERERNFTAFAAHELKTPLAGLRTQAQVALGNNDMRVRDQALKRIVESVDRTSRLVRQLLDLAEVEAGQGGQGDASVTIGDLLNDIIGGLGLPASWQNVSISISDELAQLRFHGNRVLLSLMLRNVLENALQHAPANSAVTCGLGVRESAICLTIRDSGTGMTETELRQATDRFFRAAGTIVPGSGLGLSIAKAAVERLGGTMRLENSTPSGLVVSFHLPAENFMLRPN